MSDEYDHMAEIPVTRNADKEGPIPLAWRPVLSDIVDAFVRHDYGLANGVAGVDVVDDDTATQIRDYIDDYGEKLVALPEAAWDTSVCIWAGNHWDALVDLWTEGEGRSDLVLQVHVAEHAGDYVVTVHMVYVP